MISSELSRPAGVGCRVENLGAGLQEVEDPGLAFAIEEGFGGVVDAEIEEGLVEVDLTTVPGSQSVGRRPR